MFVSVFRTIRTSMLDWFLLVNWVKLVLSLSDASLLSGSDPTNKASVSSIQRSIFTLCLDGSTSGAAGDQSRSAAAVQMLHGGGSRGYSANRWFDKTLQVTTRPQRSRSHAGPSRKFCDSKKSADPCWI